MSKLLIFTPTWKTARGTAITPECEAALRSQIVDVEWEWWIGMTNPYPIPDHRNVFLQYQMAQARLLAGDYLALLTVEQDNVLPDNRAVQRMLDTDADLIYGVYMLRHASHILNVFLPTIEGGADSISHHPGKLAQARQDGAWPVWGAGFGCTLFRRDVLERLKFRKGDDVLAWCPDLPFAQDAWKAGFESIARLDVPVTHVEYGRAIHPFEPTPVYPDRYVHSMWKKLDIWTCSECGKEAWGDEIGIWNHWSKAHAPALADAPIQQGGEVWERRL